MQIESQNKMMGESSINKAADMPTTVNAVSGMYNEYFFPGGGRWKAMSVKALTLEEATETHKARREPMRKEEPKVEEKKETTNE